MQYYTAPMEGLTDRIWRQALPTREPGAHQEEDGRA